MVFSRHSSVPLTLLVPSLGLLLAYLWALARRPDIPDYLKLKNPSVHGFPRWYGGSASPYDAQWSTRDGSASMPKDVLLLMDIPHDSPNIAHVLAIERAFHSLPSTSVRITSSFSASSGGAVGLVRNLRDMQCGEWTWRVGESGSSIEGCEGSTWISEILSSGKKLSGVGQSHDSRADIELLSRPHGLFEQQSTHSALKEHFGDAWQLGLMSYVMPLADPSIYYPTTHKAIRSITYFPSPFTPQDRIPHLQFGSTWKIYRPSSSKPALSQSSDPLAPNSKYRRFWLKEEERKADVMRSSGICIFEDWAEGQVNAEMAQAMLSGCLVATITPQTHREILDPLILNLPKPEEGDHSLPVKALARALAATDDAALKVKALRAFIVARQMMTPVSRIKEVANIVQLWREGGRGYNLPHAFSWNCESEPHPPWC